MVKEENRQCVVTRGSLLKGDLLRFVLDPEGNVTPDIRRKLPGRGVWVTASRQFVEQAVTRKAFARGFKKPVGVAKDLPDLVEELLLRNCLGSLGLAYHAGDVVTGAAKLMDAIGKQSVKFILHSSDAASDGRGKLDRKFAAVNGSGEETSNRMCMFSCEQLSATLGQPKVVHLGLKTGSAAGRFIRLVKKLEHYRAN